MFQQITTQVFKKFILLSWISFLQTHLFGQTKLNNAPFVIVSDINKVHYYPGDTICFTIKNRTPNNRGYTIEVINIEKAESNRIFNNQYYSAYFNRDTSFFKKLEKSKQISKEYKINFIIPDYQIAPYHINADSPSTFCFILNGKKIQNGIKIRIKITPDIVEGEPDFIIETKPFWLFVK